MLSSPIYRGIEDWQGMEIQSVEVGKILTRTSGYLRGITSHSLQPYQGCSLGRSLCGIGCYVQHNRYLTRGRSWGSFLEVRINAAESYLRGWESERRWARKRHGHFGVFMSSATDPFLPQEFRFRITERVLEQMLERPVDLLVLQTHSHRVTRYLELLKRVSRSMPLRVHISIESDRDRLPGLPPSASKVEERLAAADRIRQAGIFSVATVAPLLPIRNPERFFSDLAAAADAIVIDHYIGGDGTATGWRTRKTGLPAAISRIDLDANSLGYRDEMVEIARRHLPGRVGVGMAGFAGHYS